MFMPVLAVQLLNSPDSHTISTTYFRIIDSELSFDVDVLDIAACSEKYFT